MVGNAAERLKAYHMINSVSDISGNLSRNEPSLAKLRVKRNNLRSPLCLFKNIVKRGVISERRCRIVENVHALLYLAIKPIDNDIGNALALKH